MTKALRNFSLWFGITITKPKKIFWSKQSSFQWAVLEIKNIGN